MIPKELFMEALEMEECVVMPGFEAALVGIVHGSGGESHALYDIDGIVEILMQRDGMTLDDALEFFDYNILSSYVGEKTPMYAEFTDREKEA